MYPIIHTRLHSSRMRTARTLTVSPSMLCSAGGGTWFWGCTWFWGGVYLVPGVVFAPGGGVPGPGGGGLVRYPPLWTEFLTHASEIITLPETSFAGGNNLTSLEKSVFNRFHCNWEHNKKLGKISARKSAKRPASHSSGAKPENTWGGSESSTCSWPQ